MKTIKILLTIIAASMFAITTNGQTVVRSLGTTTSNSSTTVQSEQSKTINPNGTSERQDVTDYSQLSFWGFGGGYAYEFHTNKGEAQKGAHGGRIPICFNKVFKKSPVGIFGLTGYEFSRITTKVQNYSFETTVHRIPLLVHMSWNFGKPDLGVFIHGGPGLNIAAGGQTKYYENKKWVKNKIDGGADFTLGVGIGVVIRSGIIHFGFNGSPIGKSGVHQCDLDVSFILAI